MWGRAPNSRLFSVEFNRSCVTVEVDLVHCAATNTCQKSPEPNTVSVRSSFAACSTGGQVHVAQTCAQTTHDHTERQKIWRLTLDV